MSSSGLDLQTATRAEIQWLISFRNRTSTEWVLVLDMLDGNQTAENAVTHLQKRVCRKTVCTLRVAQHGDFPKLHLEVYDLVALIGAHHAGSEILGAEYSYGPLGAMREQAKSQWVLLTWPVEQLSRHLRQCQRLR